MKDSNHHSLSIVIACGGTGGHLFPGIAVAQELKKRGHRVTLLISKKNIDAKASDNYGDLDFRTVEAVALPRIPSLAVFGFMKRLWRTWRASKAILKEVQADAVLGMGGFTSLPPVLAAKRSGIRTYIHESNALPGKANRLTSRWCDQVFLGLEEASHYFDKEKCVVTGTPLRAEMAGLVPSAEAKVHFGFSPEDKIVLAMGGSQGAKNLNTKIVQAAQLCGDLCKFIVIAGPSDYERVRELAGGKEHIHVLSFCSEMPTVYSAADVVISRSGASSLTELAHVGKPSLLVPFPHAADDHQAHNARVFAAHGAAHVCREESLTDVSVAAFLRDILTNEAKRAEMAQSTLGLDSPFAAQIIADKLEHNNAISE